MKHYNFCRVVPIVWVATFALAGILLVKGFQTAAYGARFPDHTFFALLTLLVLCWFITGPRELAALRIFYRQTRSEASASFSSLARIAIRAAEAAALFISRPDNHRPQTEP